MISDNKKTLKIVLTSMLAAIICILTTFFHIPIGGNGGYIHIGDAFIYLSATILPIPYAMIASALGGGLADLFSGATMWIIPTIIIKPILVLFFTNKNKNIICTRNIFATILAGIVGTLLYCIVEYALSGNIIVAFYISIINLFQPLGSGIVFLILAYALDKLEFKNKL